nr:acid-sensing ion channel 2-like [Parasteatoda tepidariorum]
MPIDPVILNVFDIKAIPSNCYTFNGLKGKRTGSMKINIKSKVFVRLKSERGSANRFYTGSPFALQVCLHSPYGILNPFYNGFAVKPGYNYLVFPSKEVNERLPPPYASMCYNYTQMWETRSGFGPLSKRLCTEECHLNESLEHFECVDPYFIRYPNMAPICPTKQERDIYSECKELCPTTCNSEEISVDVQELPLPRYENAKTRDEFSRTAISFSFNRMILVRYKYSPKYESVALFSYIGGYLGLWLGISLVAICDIIETTLLIGQWIIEKLKRHKRIKSKVHAQNSMFEPPEKFSKHQNEMWIL